MEGRQELLVSLKGTIGAARLEIIQTLGDPAIHQHLRRKGYFTPFDPGLQEVAHIEADLFSKALRNHYLILVFDGHNRHTHGRIVELSYCKNSGRSG